MRTNYAAYEGLMEHRDVFASLCGAVLARAIRDRATLEHRQGAPIDECTDTIESLDAWFESGWCRRLCEVVGMEDMFDRDINWLSLKRRADKISFGR